ncbi:MAG: PKD domain-containing protein [Lewinellaceae bacterium]|nr:PKD domain-containing protein [Lewinella sp.]MCB9279031.1 PKD domain-containing protein [Lewinellaceae bacterium]
MKVKLKKILTTLLPIIGLVLFGTGRVLAEDIVVSGQVVFGEQMTPLPGFPVDIQHGGATLEAITDDSGHYEVTLENVNPNSIIQASAMDWCSGQLITQYLPTAIGGYTANFHICANVVDPPIDSTCAAFFVYEQISADPYIVAFYNLSAGDTWTWSFGDGTASSELEPQHTFGGPGAYPVTLTVSTSDCSASFTQQVIVGDTIGCNCPAVYDPVCAILPDGTLQQFPNACEAQCAGYGPGQITTCETDPCICPQVYDPVCVTTPDGQTITFPNSCYAECAGFGADQYVSCDGDCQCTDEWDPVCVATPGGGILSFSNPCEAECAGFTPDMYYSCDSTGCNCPQVYDPVCVFNPNGAPITFPNSCFAECAGYGPDQYAPCDGGGCNCVPEYDPVCVITLIGDTLTFTNSCFAECAGFGPDAYFSCDGNPGGGCQCYEIYAPVCVMVDSTIVEFPNDCFAACAGYGPDSFVDCNNSGCFCPNYYDPVCAVSATGDTITFGNICYALCAGFGEDQVFSCGNPAGCDACPQTYDPVCVFTPNGGFLTFPNSCYAVCAGFGPDQLFNCDGNPGDSTGCQAWFFADVLNPVGLTVQFVDQSYIPGGQATYVWSFGDGTSSDEWTPVHEYQAAGIYEVTLTITTENGCTSSHSEHICVGNGDIFQGPDCQAMFNLSQTAVSLYTFQFTDISVGNPVNWFWSFGDGTASQQQNPVHTFSNDGLYIVSLTIVTANGCSSTMSMILAAGSNVIYPDSSCQALFLPFIEQDSVAGGVFFLNLSIPPGAEFEWDFGDGTTSSEFMPLHVYSEPGVYVVTMTMTSPDGCTSTFSATVDLIENNVTGRPGFTLSTGTSDTIEDLDWTVYPNPASAETYVEWQAGQAGAYQLQLMDLNGKVIRTLSGKTAQGPHSELLQTADLVPGIYMLRLQTDQGVGVRRLIRQ